MLLTEIVQVIRSQLIEQLIRGQLGESNPLLFIHFPFAYPGGEQGQSLPQVTDFSSSWVIPRHSQANSVRYNLASDS